MIVFPGLTFEEGSCLSDDPTHFSTTFQPAHKTQEECLDYCRGIPVATGCEYIKIEKYSRLTRCRAYTYAIHVGRKKGSPDRCLVFEERNNDAEKRIQRKLRNTPNNGRQTLQTIPTTFSNPLGEGGEKLCLVSAL